ncbi:troponin C-like isoform X2 [Mya arenaria]|uniref:troponin C-like isoform X2 n=1 Tax=Mya arenaria TaxID=6604 RepID=UPI0022E5E293|nr:troponin C-like isoform X2 [Mya arenaria]
MANQWTKEEWRAKFNNFDSDHSGCICMRECKRLLQYVGLNPTDDEIQEFMKQVDKNNDDEVDFEEFYEYVKTLQDPTGELRAAFELYDTNKDGFIDKQELRALDIRWPMTSDSAEWGRMFRGRTGRSFQTRR